MSFNASVEVTEIVLKTVENVSKDLARRCILDCAKRHNFDADEELRILGLDNLTVIRKKMEKPQGIKFCLPFIIDQVDKNGCNGIAFNEGLFTQCKKVRINNEQFCKTCLDESKESENREPKNGTVNRRNNSPYYSYEDSRGRRPVSYNDYMKKKGITEAEALEEAEKQGLNIPREHFAVVSRSKKVKEKSVKKSNKCLILDESEDEKTDLFAQLISDDVSEDKETLKSGEENMSEEKKVKKAQEKADKEAKLAQEKAEKEAKAAQKALEKAERDAKVEQEKAEKAAKAAQKALEKAERDAKAEQEKAEKAALRAQEKAERDAKVEQEKAEKAAKAALKALEKAERDAKAEQEKAEKAAKAALKAQEKAGAEKEKTAEPQEEKTKVTVKRFYYNGTQYLKSSENVLYSPETKEEVGLWCEKTQSILPVPDEDESDDEN